MYSYNWILKYHEPPRSLRAMVLHHCADAFRKPMGVKSHPTVNMVEHMGFGYATGSECLQVYTHADPRFEPSAFSHSFCRPCAGFPYPLARICGSVPHRTQAWMCSMSLLMKLFAGASAASFHGASASRCFRNPFRMLPRAQHHTHLGKETVFQKHPLQRLMNKQACLPKRHASLGDAWHGDVSSCLSPRGLAAAFRP